MIVASPNSRSAAPTSLDVPAATLRKAAGIDGRTLRLRNAAPDDASFIVSLRTDPVKGAHLSTTSADIGEQQQWLRDYERRSGQAYFIIERLDAAPGTDPRLGTVRLYDPRQNSFCWGSWILAGSAPGHAAIESALMVYTYALDYLGFTAAHFTVNAGNERVWSFHERFGAKRVAAEGNEFRYEIHEAALRASISRFRRFLPAGVRVEDMP